MTKKTVSLPIPLCDIPPGFYAVSGVTSVRDFQHIVEEAVGVAALEPDHELISHGFGTPVVVLWPEWLPSKGERFMAMASSAASSGLIILAPCVELWMETAPILLSRINGLLMLPASEKTLSASQLTVLSETIGGPVSNRAGRSAVLRKTPTGVARSALAVAIFNND